MNCKEGDKMSSLDTIHASPVEDSKASELLEICRDLDAVQIRAVCAYLQAMIEGQEREEAFAAANMVLAQARRPALSLDDYRLFLDEN